MSAIGAALELAGAIVACVGQDPCVSVDSADTAIEVGDDEFWMLMAGRQLAARDRRVARVRLVDERE